MSILNSIAKRRPVYRVGINDANYVVCPRVNGKIVRCPFYLCWANMLKRCYSENFQASNPTYVGCKVTNEWHSFMAFKSWMEFQDWKGKQLDKDLIGNRKLYSPENCVFISQSLNTLFNDKGVSKGEYPLGVCWNKEMRKFQASISENGKNKHLGYFISTADAHEAWRNAKIEIANVYLSNESNSRIRYAIECLMVRVKTVISAEIVNPRRGSD